MQQPKTSKYLDILKHDQQGVRGLQALAFRVVTVNDKHKKPTTLYKTVETKQKIYFRVKKLMIITMIYACMESYPLSQLAQAANKNTSIIIKK